jgi:hypothetical protein
VYGDPELGVEQVVPEVSEHVSVEVSWFHTSDELLPKPECKRWSKAATTAGRKQQHVVIGSSLPENGV